MTTPQQPELARSQRSPVSPRSAKARPSSHVTDAPTAGKNVPEDSQPGHHPPVEQDKPTAAPSLPPRHRRFAFRRDGLVGLSGVPFGVTGRRAFVEADDETLSIRFGPWSVSTPMQNVEGAARTGPYAWWKVAGPPRLSLRDFGITFATTTSDGVCITFREPVAGALPNALLRHRAATVTVEEPDDLVRFIKQTASGERHNT